MAPVLCGRGVPGRGSLFRSGGFGCGAAGQRGFGHGLELDLLLVHFRDDGRGDIRRLRIGRGGLGAEDDVVALGLAVAVDHALHAVKKQVDHILLLGLHALLRGGIDALQLLHGRFVLGILFQAVLDGIELFLHDGLTAFQEFHAFLAGFAVAHDAAHVHNGDLGLRDLAFLLLAAREREHAREDRQNDSGNTHDGTTPLKESEGDSRPFFANFQGDSPSPGRMRRACLQRPMPL